MTFTNQRQVWHVAQGWVSDDRLLFNYNLKHKTVRVCLWNIFCVFLLFLNLFTVFRIRLHLIESNKWVFKVDDSRSIERDTRINHNKKLIKIENFLAGTEIKFSTWLHVTSMDLPIYGFFSLYPLAYIDSFIHSSLFSLFRSSFLLID